MLKEDKYLEQKLYNMSKLTEEELKERVSSFLKRNFPQIQMHGGEAMIQGVDPDSGSVEIQLGGACGGCGISPMTIQAIKRRLPNTVDGVTQVTVATTSASLPNITENSPTNESDHESETETPDAPF